MRNTHEIMEYLNIGQNRTVWEGKTLDKALEVEKQYEKEIADGTIGYGLICDFDCTPFILEDEDLTETIEKERFEEAGIVVYEIKRKEESKVYCKHCGEELIEGKNHEAWESCEPDICDHCMGEYYGYCDNCRELFVYYPQMTEHTHHGNVLCPKCRHKFQEKTKTFQVTIQCMALYNSSIEVPAYMNEKEAIEYAKEHIKDIPLGNLEYIVDSDQLEEDDCFFEED